MTKKFKNILSKIAFFVPYHLRPSIYFWLFINAFLILLNLFSYSLLIPFFSSLITIEALDKILIIKNLKIYFGLNNIKIINLLGISSIFMIFLTNILLLVNEKVKFDLIKNLSVNISNIYLKNFIKTDFIFFSKFQRTNIFTRLLLELETLVTNLFYNIFDLISRILIITFIFFALSFLSPKITFLAITSIFFIGCFIYFLIKKKITSYGQKIVKENERRTKILSIISKNFILFKVYNLSNEYIDKFLMYTYQYYKLLTNSEVLKKFPRAILEFIFFIIIILATLLYLNYFLKNNFDNAFNSQTILLLATFSIAAYRLMPSLQQIFYLFSDIRTNYPKLSKIYKEIRSLKKNRKKIIKYKIKKNNDDCILLNKVSFKYKNKFIIKNLSLTLFPNKKYCIFGNSGVGKTTLVYLILGFLKPSSGSITYKGDHIYNLENINYLISFSPDPSEILENKNIMSNILLSDKRKLKSSLELIKALKLYKIYNRQTLNKNLSSGELKRISIARALNSNSVFRVLDEPTANLDKSNKKIIINIIKKNYPGMIYVTHDLKLRDISDEIINLS